MRIAPSSRDIQFIGYRHFLYAGCRLAAGDNPARIEAKLRSSVSSRATLPYKVLESACPLTYVMTEFKPSVQMPCATGKAGAFCTMLSSRLLRQAGCHSYGRTFARSG